MAENKSKFDIWWNSPEVKQKLGAAYSLGAAVVIIGAMFKILHLPGAALMLGIGMSIEAFLFSLGIFDQPHKEYDWEKVYDFEGDDKEGISHGGGSSSNQNGIQSSSGSRGAGQLEGNVSSVPSRSVVLNYSETINDDDVKKLSDGIKNLTVTAQQFAGLSNVVGATNQFVQTIDNASAVTGKFIHNQEALNGAAGQLTTSFQGVTDGMDVVEKKTKVYAAKVEDINRNLSSINSIYEIQLKNIQAQSESLTQQTERVRSVTDGLGFIVDEVQKMKASTVVAAEEAEAFKIGTTKLSNQIVELNQVYGNMLNALS